MSRASFTSAASFFTDKVRDVMKGVSGAITGSPTEGHDLWVMLLEKAFAKFCGSYGDLEGGTTLWALQAMTGDPVRSFQKEGNGEWRLHEVTTEDSKTDVRSCLIRPSSETFSEEQFFEVLENYSVSQAGMSCSGAQEQNGLLANHSYSILHVREVRPKSRERVA